MQPEEIVATEPVTFDRVEVGDWVMPTWPHHPEGPPWKVEAIDPQDGRRLLLVGVRAWTIGPSSRHEWIVTEADWNERGASRYQWLRLTGLRRLEEDAVRLQIDLDRLTQTVNEHKRWIDGRLL